MEESLYNCYTILYHISLIAIIILIKIKERTKSVEEENKNEYVHTVIRYYVVQHSTACT